MTAAGTSTTQTTPIEFLHVGGPTVLLTVAGLRILTDPTFDPPGPHPVGERSLLKLTGPAVARADLGRIDLVLLSHDQHPDNLDDEGRVALAEAGQVLSTPAAAQRIPGVTGLQPWDSADVSTPDGGALTITAVPALHGPPGADAETMSGHVTGFVLSGADLPTVYVSGDNASVGLVRQIAQRFPSIDVAVLFAGAARRPGLDDPLTLTADDAVLAARALGGPLVVPVHTEGWLHFTEGPGTLARAFLQAGLQHLLRIPLAGVPLQT
ncbi:MBL fold metallo-hydrolase [Nakamurella lactea]|uniref:MBL fold metallo-hydrolase n=1 Tax=Nakamurella lactea TaxID=459515 RepID=UPI0003F5E705|nr:MBL fold metallo-hydrolase [Nakamurella lactea]